MGPFRIRKKRRSRPNRMKAKYRRGFKTKLSAVTLQIVLQSYRFASFIKSVPFQVIRNGSTFRLELFEKKWKTYLWYLSNAVVYACGIFQAYSFPKVILSQGLTRESSFHIGYIIFYSYGILFFFFMVQNSSTYVGMSNGLDSLLKWTQEEDWTKNKWNKSPFAVITISYFAELVGVGLPVVIALFLLHPTESRHTFSVLPAILQDRLEIFLLGMALEILIYLWIASLLQACYCYWCMTVLQKYFWLDDLCRAAENCGLDVNKWRRLFSFYRSLKCLNILHNDFSRHFLAGFIVIITAGVVLCLYCTLRAFHLVPLWVYVIFPACAFFDIVLTMVLLPFIARWEQRSADFISISMSKLRPLKLRDEEYEVLFREVRAMQVVHNEIGNFSRMSVETAQEIIYQSIDYLLLLLSL